MQKENLTIKILDDRKDIDVCALMMTGTDPWVTLGMDFEQCLGAFHGSCKEIYIARCGNEIAGFVILQVCGTLSGYIQTICINEKFRGLGFGTKLLDLA